MIRDAIIETIAMAIRTEEVCGFTIEENAAFCDDPRAPQDLRQRVCGCKSLATAAISALESAGLIVMPAADFRAVCKLTQELAIAYVFGTDPK